MLLEKDIETPKTSESLDQFESTGELQRQEIAATTPESVKSSEVQSVPDLSQVNLDMPAAAEFVEPLEVNGANEVVEENLNDQLLAREKTAADHVLENLLDHELDLNMAYEGTEKALNLSNEV